MSGTTVSDSFGIRAQREYSAFLEDLVLNVQELSHDLDVIHGISESNFRPGYETGERGTEIRNNNSVRQDNDGLSFYFKIHYSPGTRKLSQSVFLPTRNPHQKE